MEHLELVPAAAALRDQAAHVTQRLDGWIILVLGIGGAEFARKRARRDRTEQRDDKRDGPRKAGAAIHRQQYPLVI